MREKCFCGGEYKYIKKPGSGHFSGIYLKCEKCDRKPNEKVFVRLDIAMIGSVHTKTDFADLVGIKTSSVDTMVRKGRLKVVIFAKKEFIYYDA